MADEKGKKQEGKKDKKSFGGKKKDFSKRRRPVEEPKIWNPATELGKKVKAGEITDIGDIFNAGESILEAEIVDMLLPDLENELLLVGQAKGKFGGGQRRIFRQTQKKTMEGNKISFLTCAVVGNKNGYVGVSTGKSRETVPARDKSLRKAKLKLNKIRRGCGSWECGCGEPHTIPYAITGKCGSSIITLKPAPKGKGLCVEKECAKILEMAGIKDVWSTTKGQTKVKTNLINALVAALKQLSEIKIKPNDIRQLGIVAGKMKESETKDAAVPKEVAAPKDETKKAASKNVDTKKSADTKKVAPKKVAETKKVAPKKSVDTKKVDTKKVAETKKVAPKKVETPKVEN